MFRWARAMPSLEESRFLPEARNHLPRIREARRGDDRSPSRNDIIVNDQDGEARKECVTN